MGGKPPSIRAKGQGEWSGKRGQRLQLLESVRSDASPEALSKRETEVLSWVIQGKRNSEIGVILEISSRTVEKHVGRILHKLRVENRTTAAGIAFAAWQS